MAEERKVCVISMWECGEGLAKITCVIVEIFLMNLSKNTLGKNNKKAQWSLIFLKEV